MRLCCWCSFYFEKTADNVSTSSKSENVWWSQMSEENGQRISSTVTQITSCYDQAMKKSIYENTACWTLKQIGYNTKRAYQVLSLSAKYRKLRLQPHQNRSKEDEKTIAWSDESWFLMKQGESMHLPCHAMSQISNRILEHDSEYWKGIHSCQISIEQLCGGDMMLPCQYVDSASKH